MKKYTGLFFAAVMMFSIVFISEAISSNSPFSAQAQTTVRKKNRSLASRTYRGGKYVYRKGANGTRYVYRKTASGTKYVGKQTVRGGKWTYGKAKGGTKSVFSKTKKVITGDN